jgi:hypothetical protein
MARQDKGPANLQRSRGRAVAKLWLFVEGELTEPSYLTPYQRLYRGRLAIVVDSFHGPPLKLVERAIRERNRDRKVRSRQDQTVEYWCVFDCDQHPVDEALAVAEESKINNNDTDEPEIKIAASNPCIELWFLLHFEECSASLPPGDALKRCAPHLAGQYKRNKKITAKAWKKLDEHYVDARKRAAALAQMHADNRLPTHANPSSSIWKLIERMDELARQDA